MGEVADVKGYGAWAYAESLSEFGEPVHLPRSNGYLLRRLIPGTDLYDAMGCYPLFFCQNWSALEEDLAELSGEIVTVSIVADPFGTYSMADLERSFQVVNPFKYHFVVDGRSGSDIGSAHHRKEARSALRKLTVEVCHNPAGFLDEWCVLYQALVTRHNIHGIRAFSRAAFQRQLEIPGTEVLVARYEGEVIGAQIYFIHDEIAYCHLGAVNDTGYKTGAFYAMDYYSFGCFAERGKKVDLGGGIGLSGSGSDGLSLYKTGWATGTRPVYFCGRIVNKTALDGLAPLLGQEQTSYFPPYRAGEFG